jgi:hypothetical protein
MNKIYISVRELFDNGKSMACIFLVHVISTTCLGDKEFAKSVKENNDGITVSFGINGKEFPFFELMESYGERVREHVSKNTTHELKRIFQDELEVVRGLSKTLSSRLNSIKDIIEMVANDAYEDAKLKFPNIYIDHDFDIETNFWDDKA